MTRICLSSTGLYHPSDTISNAELVDSYNQFADQYNKQHAKAILQQQLEPKAHSSTDFIVKASGIESRYVLDKAHILDPLLMRPMLPARPVEQLSVQADMAVQAASMAMSSALVEASDIDLVIVACSNFQRPYPAIAVEVQAALGIRGFAFDVNVACASAAFAVQLAVDSIQQKRARSVLICSPEICTAHLNFRDRSSHFIFGDAASAMLIQTDQVCRVDDPLWIRSTRLGTNFSNNIRNNFGFLSKTVPENMHNVDKLFAQQGRQVFKEVSPMVVGFIAEHLKAEGVDVASVRRFYLHQANQHMNDWIVKKLLGTAVDRSRAPLILNEFANTSSAGSIIALHRYRDDLQPGDLAVLSAFGAGYSLSSVLLQRL